MILNQDAATTEGNGFEIQFDGSRWHFGDTAPPAGIVNALDLPEGYRNALIVDGGADTVRLNLDGDPEGTVDLSVAFDPPLAGAGTLRFDIVAPR